MVQFSVHVVNERQYTIYNEPTLIVVVGGSSIHAPNPPMIFLVPSHLGRKEMSNQNGCGKKVAALNAS